MYMGAQIERHYDHDEGVVILKVYPDMDNFSCNQQVLSVYLSNKGIEPRYYESLDTSNASSPKIFVYYFSFDMLITIDEIGFDNWLRNDYDELKLYKFEITDFLKC